MGVSAGDELWTAPLDTSYGVVEVMVDGIEDGPDASQLEALDQFLPRATEVAEQTRRELPFSFLYRLIRIAVNRNGKVGLQYRNRLTLKV